MSGLIEWLTEVPEHHVVELFEVGKGLVVETQVPVGSSKRVLRRSRDMEQAVIEVVNKGLFGEQSEAWQGLFYVMGKGRFLEFTPLYIGITRKAGGKQAVSVNIKDIEKNKSKFARWGDSSAYHIGDLSRVMFHGKASKKYAKWAQALFETYDPPTLKEPVYFYVAPWYQDSLSPLGNTCTLLAVEKEMIALASKQYGELLLNTSGVSPRQKRKTPIK